MSLCASSQEPRHIQIDFPTCLRNPRSWQRVSLAEQESELSFQNCPLMLSHHHSVPSPRHSTTQWASCPFTASMGYPPVTESTVLTNQLFWRCLDSQGKLTPLKLQDKAKSWSSTRPGHQVWRRHVQDPYILPLPSVKNGSPHFLFSAR